MAEVEIEKFEITDYDLENEFNINRPRFKQTKNQAIYGIWAEEEDDGDEEDERPSYKKKDYTTPVSFVSGGDRKQADAPEESGDEEDEEEEIDFKLLKLKNKKDFQRRKNISAYRGAGPMVKEFGGWERHTKGIGQKLLLQMGYQPGKGLGKFSQGISTPVEATLRKGKGAIGAYGPERPTTVPPSVPETEEEEKHGGLSSQWKKDISAAKKKPKYIYKTIEDVKEEGLKRKVIEQSHLSKVKVIDMTGPEQRVFSGYHAIHQQHSKPIEEMEVPRVVDRRAFDMPELLHNLDLLVNLTEQSIIQNERQLRYEKDQVVNLQHEKEKLQLTIEEEEKQLHVMKQLFEIVDTCEARTRTDSESPLTLEDCAKIFKQFQEDFYEEYKLYELPNLAVPFVHPLIKTYLNNWDPLQDSHFALDIFKEWKDILEDANSCFSHDINNMDAYQSLVWNVWMPCLRSSILKWSVRNCDPLLTLLENWLPLLPSWILENILEQLVLPKLHKEVADWNPLTDTMPIHAWLQPWLPLMNDRLDPLYSPIRHKLSNALTNWHPSDPSAKMILQPWVGVFSKGTMEAFVVKNILPKLNLCMQEFVINPHQQHLDPWHWVMAWSDMIPLHNMVSLLEKDFFPRWLQVLSTWLTSVPNYEEVTNWYMGWKSMFTDELLSVQSVKEQFSRSLDIMNRAVTAPQGLGYQPGARENIAYLATTERQRDFEQNQIKRDYDSFISRTVLPTVPQNFKDLVEQKAQEKGILFVPLPNRTQDGKQLYRFGHYQIYIDRNALFMHRDQQWLPISLPNLLSISS